MSQASQSQPDVVLPQEQLTALQAQGWEYKAANAAYAFFQKPGYWLRVSPLRGQAGWWASVMPEDSHVPDGKTWPPPAFNETELAPAFTGKGARVRALQFAKDQWARHSAYLQPLGIELVTVGVRQNRSTGGSGSSIGTKAYYRGDVEEK